MAVSQGFLDMIREMLAPLGGISARRMFGGAGVYCDGVLFALADDDVLFLKADEATKARFEADGCGRFTYEGQTGPVSMQYWRLPERVYDEPDEFLDFARDAIAVAVKSKMSKSSKPKSRSRIEAAPRPAQKRARKASPRPR